MKKLTLSFIGLIMSFGLLNAQDWTQIGEDIDGEAVGLFAGITAVSLSNDGEIIAVGSAFIDCNGNDAGRVRIFQNNSGTWEQIGNDFIGIHNNYRLGNSVSLNADGSIVAIGAPGYTDYGYNIGQVKIFQNNSGTWEQIGNDIDGEDEQDQFGISISISDNGSIVAIGASGNDGNGENAGHVRIFQNNSGTWEQIGSDINGEAEDDHSGYSVCLNSTGEYLAIGAYNNDGNGDNAGHVRVFHNNSGTWEQIGNDIDGETANDFSGFSVSLNVNGSIVAIGAIWNDGNGSKSGQVRIYQNNSGSWEQIGNDIDGEAEGDRSGRSVYLNDNGNIVAIGAYTNDGNGSDAGHVRLFQNNSGTWQQIGNDIDGEMAGDWSGQSVHLNSDGSVVSIGAPDNDGNGINAGHARVYINNSGIWEQIGEDIDEEPAGDQSGYSVSLNSDASIIAIGSPYNDISATDAGCVRIYQQISNTWQQIGSDIYGESSTDRFGIIVSLNSDGDIVAIGAPNDDENGSNAGHVKIYQNISGVWQQIGNDIDGEAAGDYSGYSINLSADGSIIAIGALYNSGNGLFAGHVRIFRNNSGSWEQIGQDIDGENEFDMFGFSVSLSPNGNVVAIGAPYSGSSGKVRIYQNISETWQQIGDIIYGEASGDQSGVSVSLNTDGNIVAIGAQYNDGNGSDAGHVRVYQNNSGTWEQIGNDIDGETEGDYSGYSVSLSSSGEFVAIGAPNNDGNGIDAGQVRIFQFISGSWTQVESDIDGETEGDYSGYSICFNSTGEFIAIGAPNNDGNGTDVGHARVYSIVPVNVDVINKNDISVSPNPTNGIINIEFENNCIHKLKICDITGKQIIEKPVLQQNETIDLSNFERGVYIISFHTEKEIFTSKIIKW